jgi:hypothetical protein
MSPSFEDGDKARLRREILDEVGALLERCCAAELWGRALVEVVRGDDGEPVVAGIDVEEILGDEAQVDAVFSSEAMRPVLPVLAKATEALCGLEDVELDDVGGGTFLRRADGGFAWMPGLVHLPSQALERRWDELVAGLEAKNASLAERFDLGRHERYDVDVEKERIVFSSGGEPRVAARATLIGTMSRASRTWGWSAYNKHLPEAVRRASAALVDSILDREIKELSEPAFATDESTAWALAALVCEAAGGEGVYRTPHAGGLVYLLLRDVRPLPDTA